MTSGHGARQCVSGACMPWPAALLRCCAGACGRHSAWHMTVGALLYRTSWHWRSSDSPEAKAPAGTQPSSPSSQVCCSSPRHLLHILDWHQRSSTVESRRGESGCELQFCVIHILSDAAKLSSAVPLRIAQLRVCSCVHQYCKAHTLLDRARQAAALGHPQGQGCASCLMNQALSIYHCF